MPRSVAFVVAAFTLAANVACKHEDSFSTNAITLENNTWKLQRYGYKAEKLHDVPSDKLSTLFFNEENKMVEGVVLCNSFESSYTLTESSIFIDYIAPTELYCGEDKDGIASFIVSTLSGIDRYKIDDNKLSIYSVESKVLEYGIK
jgi:heat shock protein HslJ